jgi:rod shape-determining protein MreB
MLFGSAEVGVDLGTANILVYVKNKGIVLNEPSVVAYDKESKKILAIGEDAKIMIGRTPGNIIAVRPLQDGVIADYEITQSMLEYVINKVVGRSLLFKPKVMICIPSGVTTVEKRAVLEATLQSGASKTYLIEEPMAAAMGAGIDVSEARGSIVMDIGGGTTDVAVMCLGGIVISESVRVGGDRFDEAIMRYVKKVHNVQIGERSAENIKMEIGTVREEGVSDVTIDVKGRDIITGMPTTITMTSKETRNALIEPINRLVACVKSVLEQTPPELSADIVDRGIVLTGGGALLDGLAELVQEKTGITAIIADNPLDCVALGTGQALSNLSKLKESSLMKSKS